MKDRTKRQVELIKQGKCPFCESTDKNFKDKESEEEHILSGLCQDCQDEIFAGDTKSKGKGNPWQTWDCT